MWLKFPGFPPVTAFVPHRQGRSSYCQLLARCVVTFLSPVLESTLLRSSYKSGGKKELLPSPACAFVRVPYRHREKGSPSFLPVISLSLSCHSSSCRSE